MSERNRNRIEIRPAMDEHEQMRDLVRPLVGPLQEGEGNGPQGNEYWKDFMAGRSAE